MFPLTNPRPKTHSNSWFDIDLQVLMYEKEKLLKKYVNKKTPTAKVKYSKARNLYYRTIQQKKILRYSFLFDKQKNSLKQALNKLLGRKKSKITQCPSLITLVNKKKIFCYVTNQIVILANLGALILKIQLVFFYHITFLR